MKLKTIFVTEKNYLSLKLNNLIIKSENRETSIPLSDISVIMLDNPQIAISASLLSKIADSRITLFTCNDKHTPNGIYIPFNTHCRFSGISRLQIELSEPFKKRCWQKIIKAKINNQFEVLKSKGLKNHVVLERLRDTVLSGDSSNLESQVARIYFQSLFDNFVRVNKPNKIYADIRNIALNYGYSIIRGAVARSIATSGLFPSIGVHHDNQFNAFNLADDLIEPFRAFVDIVVFDKYRTLSNFNIEFTKKDKADLLLILQNKVVFNGKRETILFTCGLAVQSYAKAVKNNKPDDLLFPSFLDDGRE
jgi:CRISPR-associated protein Cas1